MGQNAMNSVADRPSRRPRYGPIEGPASRPPRTV